MVRKILAILILLLCATQVWAKNNSEPKLIVCVFPNGKITKAGGKTPLPKEAHYEITESLSTTQDTEATYAYVIANEGIGSGFTSSKCTAEGVVHSVTGLNGFNTTKLGPLSVRNKITVVWVAGKNNEKEPASGLRLTFFHASVTYAEAAGAGFKDIVGSAKAKAEAKTQGPGGSTKSNAESSAPIIGVDADPEADNQTFILDNIKSGWKSYISAQITVVGSTWIFGSAEAEASAEISWEAELENSSCGGKK